MAKNETSIVILGFIQLIMIELAIILLFDAKLSYIAIALFCPMLVDELKVMLNKAKGIPYYIAFSLLAVFTTLGINYWLKDMSFNSIFESQISLITKSDFYHLIFNDLTFSTLLFFFCSLWLSTLDYCFNSIFKHNHSFVFEIGFLFVMSFLVYFIYKNGALIAWCGLKYVYRILTLTIITLTFFTVKLLISKYSVSKG